MNVIPCFHVSSFLFIQNIIRVMLSARKNSAFAACSMSTFIGFTSAIIPKNNSSSIIKLPSKSPSPMLACFFASDLNSTAMSGSVVPIPITVNAMK